MSQRILIVEDDPVQRRLLENTLQRFGYRTQTAEDGEQALQLITSHADSYDLLLLDLLLPKLSGLELLTRLRQQKSAIPVIVQTAHAGLEKAVEAMRAGAQDFVVKPVPAERLRISVANLLRTSALEEEITRFRQHTSLALGFDQLATRSEAMERVLRLGKRAASSTIPILIEGESGVGKEMIARAIQGSSDRRSKPFITVNCGAIPDHLVESILFGHEKGAFTGAHEKHRGKFQEANGGTLFLDEVGELPLEVQVKLLRALQEGEVDPVGARKPVKCDFRLISATNRRLLEQVKEGKFREDLYYRLNVFPIWIPPLKDRLEDLPQLLHQFMARFSAEESKPHVCTVAAQTLVMLQSYDWPGNIRQLQNAVYRAVVLCDSDVLAPEDFPQIIQAISEKDTPSSQAGHQVEEQHDTAFEQLQAEAFDPANPPFGYLSALTPEGHIQTLAEVEKQQISLALDHYSGRMTEVAKRLGIGRSTLYRKLKDYNLSETSEESAA
ncbi:sigma-54-dependent transcriptional regulator [Polycladidibacter hongkongensis]|uniref:sigma-54-dependent transcriptional regulator n=1 Tax=Polycladidibacter hongkongensis TaxID=1647556 RepID=UPI000829A6C4|nr:sigma-54 dependent transcriptional regulator [Pseudovibrio hongkongensis]